MTALDLEHSRRILQEEVRLLVQQNTKLTAENDELGAQLAAALPFCKRLQDERDAAESAHAETRRQLEEARRELSENDGVIAVWRGRTERAEAEAQRAVLEERERLAREFESRAEAIGANARDPHRPNIGCTVEECLEAAQQERRVAALIRAREAQGTEAGNG